MVVYNAKAERGDVTVDSGRDSEEFANTLPHINEKRLKLKIDAHVLLILCVLYFLAFPGCINMGHAVDFGLQEDLGMDPQSNQFNVALRPHVWLSRCMFSFGILTLGQGFVKCYGGLLATRFFLGVTEPGMFPGSVRCTSPIYFFLNSTTLDGAFGGLIAYGTGTMQGMRGYGAWRWLFIIEGAFPISDFPKQARWLTENERRWVKKRLEDGHGDKSAEYSIRFTDVLNVLKDYKIFLGALIYFSFLVPSYCYAYFSPTIIKSYGHSTLQTQLHSVPPSAMVFFLSLGIAFASDRLQHRYYLRPPAARNRYRAAAGFGEIAGIVSTFLFPSKDAPYYHVGYSVVISFFTLAAFWSTCYFLACWAQNRSRDRLMADLDSSCESKEASEGDLAASYRYML
ncbi:major facilitator superfamily domain-containing protein [Aspergillus alliaceus]|uniref:major facilitator superfamily domain-containing protein n=1 Tax=Petromyces alliaceus TaxID=209559 RepID=UPI0012A3FE7A|nr:major facilitator superfamily domain-containing protein [Aspergillus alliaceus]KAB8232599.1 major facilitator superfamily domain-containing protein [Aspergillus alliaceus]